MLIFVAIAALILIGLGVAGSIGSPRKPKQFSTEYVQYIASPQWRARRKSCMIWTFGRDCLFPWLPATDVDHLHYRHLGHELPFFDIVPLHRSTHIAVTRLREMLGRGPVNIVLQTAFALWFLPYVAIAIAIVCWRYPSIWHGLHAYLLVLRSHHLT